MTVWLITLSRHAKRSTLVSLIVGDDMFKCVPVNDADCWAVTRCMFDDVDNALILELLDELANSLPPHCRRSGNLAESFDALSLATEQIECVLFDVELRVLSTELAHDKQQQMLLPVLPLWMMHHALINLDVVVRGNFMAELNDAVFRMGYPFLNSQRTERSFDRTARVPCETNNFPLGKFGDPAGSCFELKNEQDLTSLGRQLFGCEDRIANRSEKAAT